MHPSSPLVLDPEVLRGHNLGAIEETRLIRTSQVRLGVHLLALRRAHSFSPFRSTTFPLYCESIGLSPQEGRELAAVAEAAEVRPEVFGLVAEGKVSVQKAALVAPLLLDAAMQKPGEDWVAKASSLPHGDLRDLVRQRREEVAQGTPTVPLRFCVSEKGRDDFGRCWDLASRKAGRGLTEGQAFETVCDDYLERHDPLREAVRLEAKDKAEASLKGKALGTEDLVSSPRSRAIPAFTERSILREFGDRCMVEGCENRRFLDFAHIRPFRLGGRQVPANLIRFCKEHHVQFDEGSWRLAPTKDGGLVMISRAGTPVGRLRMASSHPPPTVPP